MKIYLNKKLINKIDAIFEKLESKKYDKDKAIFLINLILSGTLKNQVENPNDWVNLCSKILQKYIGHDYKTYINVFVSEGVIEKKNYSHFFKTCNKFRIHKRFLNKNTNLSKLLEVKNEKFIKKIKLNINKSNNGTKYRYLKKFIEDKKFTIKYNEAINYVLTSDLTEHKKAFNIRNIEFLKEKIIWFKNNPKTDKRLHTNITNLKSEIRQFLRWNNKNLKNIDIKNSQIYFLSSILKNKTKYNHINILEGNRAALDFGEVERFNDLVIKGIFYDVLGEKLMSEKGKNGIYIKSKYCIKDERIKHKVYTDPRKLMKNLVFEILFSDNHYHSIEKTWFKNEFPTIFRFTEQIKSNKKNALSLMLQNMEAKAVLDLTCTSIHNFNNKIPLFTIHDSIMTIDKYCPIVSKIMTDTIYDFTGIVPPLSVSES